MSLNLGRTEFGDPANKGNVLSVSAAYELFNAWVLNPKLQRKFKRSRSMALGNGRAIA